MISRTSKITIVGLGLLGGSYAKGLFSASYPCYGIDIDPQAIDFAKKYHWIKDGSQDPNMVKDSDIVIFALYPTAMITWLRNYQHLLKPGSLITDVTGIKKSVITEIQTFLRDDVEYISCHPMAGREYKGIQYADCTIFHQANFIIVPTEKNTTHAIETVTHLAQILRFAKISTLTMEEHDRMIGFLSQLTHVIAVSLMNVSDNPHLQDYTGDSFRDLTRIAKINESLWPELFVLNKGYLVDEIDRFIDELNSMKQAIETEDMAQMKEKMIQSTNRRKAFDKQ